MAEAQPARDDGGKSKQRRKVTEDQLYEPIRSWLQTKGLIAEITARRRPKFLIPVGDYLGVSYIEPDVVAHDPTSKKTVAIEVKSDAMFIFDGIGRCIALRAIADLVYLALPKRLASNVRNPQLLEKAGIGLLSVSDAGEVEEVIKASWRTPYLPDLYSWIRGYITASLKRGRRGGAE